MTKARFTERVPLYVTPEMKAYLEAVADKEDKPVTQYIRELITKDITERKALGGWTPFRPPT